MLALLNGRNTDGHVQALLIDAASGRVVHDARHAGCDGPLTMVLGENWVVYEYWSPALLQHQVTVSELFTNATHTGAAADDVLSLILAGRVDYTDPANHFDSFSAAAATPHVLTQTYAFGAAVAAMAVTQTAAGIAPKYVMHLTASGMLMSMDKRMLDPRRPLVNPKSMSAADREEGLVPYSPSLGGVNPLLVASHRNTIARPRALLCAPATLESTSLVAAVGLDLYLTRVAPAREFDRLNEDFNYVALLGSIVVLVVAQQHSVQAGDHGAVLIIQRQHVCSDAGWEVASQGGGCIGAKHSLKHEEPSISSHPAALTR